MGALEFPCEECGKVFAYSELVGHVCRGKAKVEDNKSEIEVIDLEKDDNEIVTRKRSFNSLGLNVWNGESLLKKTPRRKKSLTRTRLSMSPLLNRTLLGSGIKEEPKKLVSAREAGQSLGLNMRWGSSKPKPAETPNETNLVKEEKGNFIPTDQSKYYDKLDHYLDKHTVELKKLKYDASFPLSEVLRPKTLQDYVGHRNIVGPDGIITKCIYTGVLPSMILWGEPGVGKTTLVRLILTEIKKSSFAKFYQINELSAASSNLTELRAMYEKFKQLKKFNSKMKMILFLDEIHRFSKLQQDFFLSLIENNEMIFFGCTTENPSYKINDAMLSRCQMFNLQKATPEEILLVINNGLLYINKSRILLSKQRPLLLTKPAKEYLSEVCDGDFRTALNSLEAIAQKYTEFMSDQERAAVVESDLPKNTVKKICVDVEDLKSFLRHTILRAGTKNQAKDLFSALYKCIVGGDANAAFIYLAYIFETKPDPLEIANFLHGLLVNEIDESCKTEKTTLLEFSNAVYYTVTKLGLPECDLALVQFTYLLSKAPKSLKITKTVSKIESFLNDNPTALSLSIPMHIRNAPTQLMKDLGYHEGYKYNPNFKRGKVKQYYLPRGIRKASFTAKKDFGNSVDLKRVNRQASQCLLDRLYDSFDDI